MKTLLKAFAISTLLLVPAAATPAQAQVRFGISIGTPPPAPRYYRVSPRPGQGYEWVEGYWYPRGGHYVWRNGYWVRPPYAGAYWARPYYDRGRYYSGHWNGDRNQRHRRDWHRDDRHDNRRDDRRR